MKLAFLLLFIAAYKVVSNTYYYIRIRKLRAGYFEWLKDKYPKYPQCKREFSNLIHKANIKDIAINTTENIGYGKIASFPVSAIDNFPSKLESAAYPAVHMFDEALGVYKGRIFETINPIYWIDTILFFPKRILQYIGMDINKASFRLWNTFLTFIWWCIGTGIGVFGSEIHDAIIKIIQKF